MIALDFISKQHTMPPTKEPQSSILHVDHFLFNLFCLAEATGLIKEQSLQNQSLKGGLLMSTLKEETLFLSIQGVLSVGDIKKIRSLKC